MLDRAQLEEAVDLQKRSYQLMVWLGEAIRRRFVSFDTAHEYASASESARAWILEHWANIPQRCRPPESSGPGLVRFANVFTSYLETSFEFVEKPGTRLRSDCGCFCPYCTYAVQVPHLKPKRIGAPDKNRARSLARTAAERLAASSSIDVSRETVESLLTDREVLESAALVAYAEELFRRCDGLPTGEHVLALWRLFAWKPTGSPKPNFELTLDAVLAAEASLHRALQRVESQ